MKVRLRKPGILMVLTAGLFLASSSPAAGADWTMNVPDRVRPGGKVVVTSRNAGLDRKWWLQIDVHPRRYSGKTRWINKKYFLVRDPITMRFRWPKTFHGKRWRRGSRAVISIAALYRTPVGIGGGVSISRTVRIGKAPPKAKRIPVVRNRARVRYPCKVSYRCTGKITVKRGKKELAEGRYSVGPGRTGNLKIPLTRAGRAALARHGSVRASLKVNPDRTRRSVTIPVILKR